MILLDPSTFKNSSQESDIVNIFVTDVCPKVSAQNLDDKRVIKMALESAQMLSTALHEHDSPWKPYKINHKNHPCTIWARTTRANYQWLLDHLVALCSEYEIRYGKIHACAALIPGFEEHSVNVPEGELTPFPNCTIYKDETDVIEAYKRFMDHKWNDLDVRPPTWRVGSRPEWSEVRSALVSA